ncbi:MAG: 50S ribosomal protein L29 [Nitrospinae bacterium CG11_big_fil_rev_8_21_14_0_20_45_15]|nr:MAG: 50S ribosomal protein L29 [Nitrospinae bacterium CG11_big_fil_rev_8_21_14_0_20_45_15]
MKPLEIRELSEKERSDKIADLSQEYFNLKFQVATGKIEDPSRLKYIRRDLARIKTIQQEFEGKAQGAGAGVDEKQEPETAPAKK